MTLRTALLIDITKFGPDIDDDEELPLESPTWPPLPLRADVDALQGALAEFGFDVRRPSNSGNEPTAAGITAIIDKLIAEHSDGDVVVVYVLSHGTVISGKRSLYILGSDGEKVCTTDWLIKYDQEYGPYVLFLLDVCYAGAMVDVNAALRTGDPDRLWLLAAATSAEYAFEARFTKALVDVLDRIRGGDERLGLRSDHPYAGYGLFAQEVSKAVERRVAEIAGTPQNVIATVISASLDTGSLPFFENPRFRADDVGGPSQTFPRTALVRLGPKDAGYFAAAAGCGAPSDAVTVNFVGRGTELVHLVSWMDDHATGGLAVVTGRSGVGKSALLGVVACAAHRELRSVMNDRLRTVPGLPDARPRVAVINARHRDTRSVVEALAAQLVNVGDPYDGHIHDARDILDEMADRQALVIIDSVDESATGDHIARALLLPLAGLRGCQVLIAAGGGTSVTDTLLSDSPRPALVIDLDDADRTSLRRDVAAVATEMLSRTHYADEGHADAVRAFVQSMSTTLTASERPPDLGEFLITRLYVAHVVNEELLAEDAASIGAAVPRNPIELFETELSDGRIRWVRPVLAALALGRGSGLPLRLIPALAALCTAESESRLPTIREVAAALNSAGTYVRVTPGEGDSVVFGLCHEELAELLRTRPRADADGPVDPKAVFDALVSLVRDNGGWGKAHWYLRCHLLGHARDASCAATLLNDAAFVLDSGVTAAELSPVEDASAAAAAAVAELDAVLSVETPAAERASLLAAAAARHDGSALARSVTARTPHLLVPVFAQPVSSDARIQHVTTRSWLAVVEVGDVLVYDLSDLARPRQRVAGLLPKAVAALDESEPSFVVWSLDGSIVVISVDGVVRSDLKLRPYHGTITGTAAMVLDGHRLVFTAGLQGLLVQDLDSEKNPTLTLLDGSLYRLVSIGFPQGRRGLALQSLGGVNVIRPDVSDLSVAPRVKTLGSYVLICDLDGVGAALCWDHQGICRINLATGAMTRLGRGSAIPAIAASVPGSTGEVVVVDRAGNLSWQDMGNSSPRVLGSVGRAVSQLEICRGGGRDIVACGTDAGVALWDLTTGAEFAQLGSRSIHSLATAVQTGSEHGPTFAIGTGFGGTVLADETADGSVRVTYIPQDEGPAHSGHLPQHRFDDLSVHSRDGWAAVVTHQGTDVSVWHPLTREPLMPPSPAPLSWISFTDRAGPDVTLIGDRLYTVSGDADGKLVFDALDGSASLILDAHDGPIVAVSTWTANTATYAASAGNDRWLKMWDVTARTVVRSLFLSAPIVLFEALPGNRLVVRTDDETVVVSTEQGSEMHR